MHRRANFDTGGISVEDQASGFACEDFQESSLLPEISFRSMNRCRQASFEVPCHTLEFALRVATNQYRRGTEYFVPQFGVSKKSQRVRFKKRRQRTAPFPL